MNAVSSAIQLFFRHILLGFLQFCEVELLLRVAFFCDRVIFTLPLIQGDHTLCELALQFMDVPSFSFN